MTNFFKGVLAMAIAVGLTTSSLVFAIDSFSANANISAKVTSEKIGILAADISATDTTITLESGSTLVNGLVLIGDEIVLLNGTTITRAQTHPHTDSTATTAAVHSIGSEIRNIVQNIEVKFTPSTALVSTDEVVLTIPNNSPVNFGAMGTATATGATVVNDTNARTFTLIGLTGSSEQTVTITGAEMPEVEGQYGLPVEIRTNSGSLLETGSALVSWASNLVVKAIIQPALIFTLDKTNIEITANPSVNDGEDYSQKSILNVKTNSKNGYKIFAKLEGKENAGTSSAVARLDSSITGDSESIVSADATSTENAFSYVSYNGNGSSFEQAVTSAGRTAMNNIVTRTRDEIKSDILNSGIFSVTDSVLLPVTKLGADVVPGNSGANQLGFDSYINEAKHTVYYLLNVDYELASGNYEGVVTYTAVPSF